MQIYNSTSEKWHFTKYGTPEECYKKYCIETRFGKNTAHEYINLLKYEYDEKFVDLSNTHINKWNNLVKIFGNVINGRVLDIGGPGLGAMFLLRRRWDLSEIISIDGNKYSIEAFRPHLDKKIKSICCDFSWFPEISGEFDTILQIDFAEHVSDDLYKKITKWALSKMKQNGSLIIYTPEFPNCIDQLEHISVKSTGFFLNFFLSLGLTAYVEVNNGRIFMVVRKEKNVLL